MAERANVTLDLLRHDLRPTPAGDAYEIERANPFLQELERQFFTPDGVTPVYNSSVADENVFAKRLGIPVLTLGPIGMGEHSKDEWVSRRSLLATRNVYQKIIELYSSFPSTP